MKINAKTMTTSNIFKMLFSTIILTLCSQTSTAKEPISAKEFRDVVVAIITKKHPTACIKLPDDRTIYFGENKKSCDDMMLSIDHSYGLYLDSHDDLPHLTSNLAGLASDSFNIKSDTVLKYKKEQLAVVLRHQDYIEFLSKNNKKNRNIWKPFVGDLIALMIFDDVKTIKTVSITDLSDLQLDEETAWKIANANVRQNIGQIETGDFEGITTIYAQSGFATGLLWLPEACTDKTEDFLAMVMDRDSYIYTNTENEKASATLTNLAGYLVIEGGSLSDNLLLCKNSDWFAFAFSKKVKGWTPVK